MPPDGPAPRSGACGSRRPGRLLLVVLALTITVCGPAGVASASRTAPVRTAALRTAAPRGAAASASAWDEPALSHPVTVPVTNADRNLKLDQSQDYILACAPGTTRLSSTLSVWGGHNVVLRDCDLHVNRDWVAYFHNQTGTLWVHDVHFGGTRLTGGIQLQEPGATVVMRDVLFDKVYGSYTTNHAELLQTWAGPKRLMIDGLTGADEYQGLFLLPNQWYAGPAPTVFDLRHIDIDNSQGGYALWLADVNGRIRTWNVQDTYVVPNPGKLWRGWWLWPKPESGDNTWNSVIAGRPPGGHYVRATPGGATGVDGRTTPRTLPGERS